MGEEELPSELTQAISRIQSLASVGLSILASCWWSHEGCLQLLESLFPLTVLCHVGFLDSASYFFKPARKILPPVC